MLRLLLKHPPLLLVSSSSLLFFFLETLGTKRVVHWLRYMVHEPVSQFGARQQATI